MRVAAVIPAAGLGRRMRQDTPKTYLHLAGKPILIHTLEVFERVPEVHEVLVVVHPEDLEFCQEEVIDAYPLKKVLRLVPGGKERQDSVYHALKVLWKQAKELDIILVHDGVRPLVDPVQVGKVVAAARRYGGAILGIPCQDTLKRVNPKGEVLGTVDRRELWQIQTPQAFRAALLWRAYQQAMERGFYATDEAALVEALGESVVVVPGSPLNLKITTPDDLKIAEAILAAGLIK
uniref:2-C-methyl-D-erythritol 4-phosphate cytidylyltransferase n=1 Tax=Desulfobacca acetoxidans TaxID=60893 RepID=A0A7C3V6N6_9BACT